VRSRSEPCRRDGHTWPAAPHVMKRVFSGDSLLVDDAGRSPPRRLILTGRLDGEPVDEESYGSGNDNELSGHSVGLHVAMSLSNAIESVRAGHRYPTSSRGDVIKEPLQHLDR
jgi:hypothetical protein